jgi:transposase
MLAVSQNKSDSEATSMGDPTSLLFGLDEFTVVDVVRVAEGLVEVVVETANAESACPDCGTRSGRVKDRPRVRIKDLPASGQRVRLWWRKRRLLCLDRTCARLSELVKIRRTGLAGLRRSTRGVNRCTHRSSVP